MCIFLEDISSSSLSFSNHSPFLKLFKVCLCCVGSASRHGHLFTVSLKSQPIYQSFQSLFFVVCMLLADMASYFQSLQITAHFSRFPRFILTFVHAAQSIFKLSKVCHCCVHAARRHGKFFKLLFIGENAQSLKGVRFPFQSANINVYCYNGHLMGIKGRSLNCENIF